MPTRRNVYILRSEAEDRIRFYVGSTSDVGQRLKAHNAGNVPHTAKHRPWTLHATFWFADDRTATAFERYLKSGSGRAFASRHTTSSTRTMSSRASGARTRPRWRRRPRSGT